MRSGLARDESGRNLPSLDVVRAEKARRRAEAERLDLERNAEAIRARCLTLTGFVREAWHVIEPTARYVHSWHIDILCAHLEAVTAGRITRLLINVPPGPMRDDSVVETGRGPIPLRDVAVGDVVLTHRGRYRPVTATHDQGVLPILRIETHSGRVTHAAPSHPYLTPRGWVDARDLCVGDLLAVVNRAEDRPDANRESLEIARLLGYLVGDGSLAHGAGFTNGDREVVDDFRACAAFAGFTTAESWRKTHWQVRLHGGASVRSFLDQYGLAGCDSYSKRIPQKIMAGDRETIANFVGAFWTCDGGFDVRPTGKRGSRFRAYGTTVSEGLATDLVYALGLLGIESRLRRKARSLDTAAQAGGIYRSFSVEVQKERMTAKFADMPGLCSTKNALARKCVAGFSDILWEDPIISIEPKEAARCMCLTVDDDESFVCSGIAVKNTMKSLLVSVLWPAWEWGPQGLRSLRYLATSFNDGPVKRDTRKCRDLILSEWYQKLWPEVKLTRTGETSFANSATGTREGIAFGSLTSQRGDRLICDDIHSVKTAESDVQRAETTRLFRERAIFSINDPARSAIVVVMQRLHEDDVSGVILALKMGFVHLRLPMEFEAANRCVTLLGVADLRQNDGDLLDPERYPREYCRALESEMGNYGYATQFQQRPAPRAGGFFNAAAFPIVQHRPLDADVRLWVRAWDLAGSKTGDWTVGALMAALRNGRWALCNIRRLRGSPDEVDSALRETATLDGTKVTVSLAQDPGQAGKAQVGYQTRMLAGFKVISSPETGDKATRAAPFASQANAGGIDMVAGDWNQDFLAELRNFPNGAYDDQVDACSRAFAHLIEARRPMMFTAESAARLKALG